MISDHIPNDIPPPPKKKIEYGYPHFNAFLQFRLKLERCKPQKAARHPTIMTPTISDSISQGILSQNFVPSVTKASALEWKLRITHIVWDFIKLTVHPRTSFHGCQNVQ